LSLREDIYSSKKLGNGEETEKEEEEEEGVNMSYAEVTKKGGPQDPAEAAAPQLPEVVSETDSVQLIDVDSGVSVVSSDFASQPVQTTTQADRLDLEAAVAAEEDAARKKAAGKTKKEKAKAKGKQAADDVTEFFRDPVNATNAVLSTVVVLGVSYGAWRKWKLGELTWGVVGVWTAGVAVFSLGDYFASQWATDFFAKKKKSN